jgi:hypothetical protein
MSNHRGLLTLVLNPSFKETRFTVTSFATYKVKAARYDVKFSNLISLIYFDRIITKSFGYENDHTIFEIFRHDAVLGNAIANVYR